MFDPKIKKTHTQYCKLIIEKYKFILYIILLLFFSLFKFYFLIFLPELLKFNVYIYQYKAFNDKLQNILKSAKKPL